MHILPDFDSQHPVRAWFIYDCNVIGPLNKKKILTISHVVYHATRQGDSRFVTPQSIRKSGVNCLQGIYSTWQLDKSSEEVLFNRYLGRRLHSMNLDSNLWCFWLEAFLPDILHILDYHHRLPITSPSSDSACRAVALFIKARHLLIFFRVCPGLSSLFIIGSTIIFCNSVVA